MLTADWTAQDDSDERQQRDVPHCLMLTAILSKRSQFRLPLTIRTLCQQLTRDEYPAHKKRQFFKTAVKNSR